MCVRCKGKIAVVMFIMRINRYCSWHFARGYLLLLFRCSPPLRFMNLYFFMLLALMKIILCFRAPRHWCMLVRLLTLRMATRPYLPTRSHWNWSDRVDLLVSLEAAISCVLYWTKQVSWLSPSLLTFSLPNSPILLADSHTMVSHTPAIIWQCT